MLLLTFFLATLFPHVAIFFPNQADSEGWGLRLHGLSVPGPLLENEQIEQVRFRIVLINFTKNVRHTDALLVAWEKKFVSLTVTRPNGMREHPQIGDFAENSPPIKHKLAIQPGGFIWCDFTFQHFGYNALPRMSGRYQLELGLLAPKIGEGSKGIKAPVIEIEALLPRPQDILASTPVPLAEIVLARPIDARVRPMIEQIKIGGQTWLFYRLFAQSRNGEVAFSTFRVAELTGEVKAKVVGVYGDWGPLTITYEDKNSSTGTTTHIINCINGRPWTQKEQEIYDFNHNIAPAPRAKP